MVRFLRPCVKQYFCDGKSVTYKALGYPQDIGGCGLFDPVSCRVRLQAHHVPEHLVRLKAHPRGVKPSFALLRQVRVMSNYRRPRIPGATIFFKVALERRGADTLVRHVEALRVAVRRTMAERPFRIEAAVILPDHLHMIWTLPAGDSDFPNRWRMIKARFTHAGPNTRNRRASHIARREAGLWQRRYWERHIRSAEELAALTRYCWVNPVKHGLVTDPFDWPFSSIHRDGMPGVALDLGNQV